jgi:hypothetical protein
MRKFLSECQFAQMHEYLQSERVIDARQKPALRLFILSMPLGFTVGDAAGALRQDEQHLQTFVALG